MNPSSVTLPPATTLRSPVRRPPLDRFIGAASIATLLLIWFAFASLLPNKILPSPTIVLTAMGELAAGPQLWSDILITLKRIAGAFALAMTIAIALGFSMALSPRAGAFFRMWVVCGITIPAIVTILMLYLIVGLNEKAAVLGAAMTVVPFLSINIREGVKSIDSRLGHMAKVFRASRIQTLKAIIVPQVAPMLLASARFGLGLAWKMVLFVELLGRSDGVGYRIETYYQLFDMTNVLAYALSFLIVMVVIEIGIFGSIERRVFKWRLG